MKTFWQHDNGKMYVVESDSFGTIIGAAGPLDTSDPGDPSDYDCGPGILAWLRHAIVAKKLRRINPMGPRDAVTCPIARLQTPVIRSPAPPASAEEPQACESKPDTAAQARDLLPADKPEPQNSAPNSEQRDIDARKRFAWSTAYGL